MLQPFKVLKIDAKLIFFQLATPRITDTRSRQLPDSTIRGVDDSSYNRYREFSFKKFNSRLSLSLMRGVIDSAYQWCRESSTPRIVKSESRRLPVSLSWGGVFRIYEYLREFKAKIGTARNVMKGTYAKPIYAKTSENSVRCHVPLRSPGINAEESIPPGWESIPGLLKRFTNKSLDYIGWRNRFLGSLKV